MSDAGVNKVENAIILYFASRISVIPFFRITNSVATIHEGRVVGRVLLSDFPLVSINTPTGFSAYIIVNELVCFSSAVNYLSTSVSFVVSTKNGVYASRNT